MQQTFFQIVFYRVQLSTAAKENSYLETLQKSGSITVFEFLLRNWRVSVLRAYSCRCRRNTPGLYHAAERILSPSAG